MNKKDIFARAFPQECRIMEEYSYEQEISRNPYNKPVEKAKGAVEIEVPYDGYRFFARKALRDVTKYLRNDNEYLNALIGYLAFTDHSSTDIRSIPGFIDHCDSMPVHIPIRNEQIRSEKELIDDAFTAQLRYEFNEDLPEVIPVQVIMNLFDEDQLSSFNEENEGRIGNIAKDVTSQISFKRNLILLILIKLDLPLKIAANSLHPRLNKMSISWPTITSFQTLELEISGELKPIKYNPTSKSLEWSDVEFAPEKRSTGTDLKSYTSPPMLLNIGQPGELYQQQILESKAIIDIPDFLLSGMKARLFSSTGSLLENVQPELKTKLRVQVNMILDDAFSRRIFSPYQQLHFDEVIPDEMRIADIRAILVDRGFQLDIDRAFELNNPKKLKHVISAMRAEGPNTFRLWLVVEGERFETERQAQVQGGQTYISTLESGLMKVYMRSQLSGDNQTLIREMNTIRLALHDRFERIRAKR